MKNRPVPDGVSSRWARVEAAEAEYEAASERVKAFGVLDPTKEWTPEYEEATEEARTAWIRAEGARHEMDQFVHPKRYAEKGHRAEALDRFRVWAAADREPGQ